MCVCVCGGGGDGSVSGQRSDGRSIDGAQNQPNRPASPNLTQRAAATPTPHACWIDPNPRAHTHAMPLLAFFGESTAPGVTPFACRLSTMEAREGPASFPPNQMPPAPFGRPLSTPRPIGAGSHGRGTFCGRRAWRAGSAWVAISGGVVEVCRCCAKASSSLFGRYHPSVRYFASLGLGLTLPHAHHDPPPTHTGTHAASSQGAWISHGLDQGTGCCRRGRVVVGPCWRRRGLLLRLLGSTTTILASQRGTAWWA